MAALAVAARLLSAVALRLRLTLDTRRLVRARRLLVAHLAADEALALRRRLRALGRDVTTLVAVKASDSTVFAHRFTSSSVMMR